LAHIEVCQTVTIVFFSESKLVLNLKKLNLNAAVKFFSVFLCFTFQELMFEFCQITLLGTFSLSRNLDQEIAKGPFRSSSQAVTCYYQQSNHSKVVPSGFNAPLSPPHYT